MLAQEHSPDVMECPSSTRKKNSLVSKILGGFRRKVYIFDKPVYMEANSIPTKKVLKENQENNISDEHLETDI